MMNIKRLRQHLSYDPITGIITWIKPKRGTKMGAVAGSAKNGGYRRITFDGKTLYAHRVGWVLFHGRKIPKGKEIDHRNGMIDDNPIKNLRIATRFQQRGNSRPQIGTQYKGVRRANHGRSRGWEATCRGKYIGIFPTKREAALAYDVQARREYGEFARTNF